MPRPKRRPDPEPAPAPVAVVVAPSPLQPALQEALKALAHAAGRRLREAAGIGDDQPLADGELLLTDASVLDQLPPSGALALVVDTPAATSAWVEARHGVTPTEAVLFAAGRLAEASTMAGREGALVMTAGEFEGQPAHALDRLARRLGLRVAPSLLADLARELRPSGARTSAPGPLDVYAALPMQAGATARWPRDLFRFGDAPEAVCPPVIDLTGRQRILVFGPYFPLPRGRWRARIEFEVCEDAARKTYFFQFGAGAGLAELVFRPGAPGRHAVILEQTFEAVAPAEIRAAMLRPAFHGEFRFLGVDVTCVDAGPPDLRFEQQ